MATIRERGDAPGDLSTSFAFAPGDVFLGELATDVDSDWVRTEVSVGNG
jgi:hypothetical protein